jgi:hypothetical protein
VLPQERDGDFFDRDEREYSSATTANTSTMSAEHEARLEKRYRPGRWKSVPGVAIGSSKCRRRPSRRPGPTSWWRRPTARRHTLRSWSIR